MNEAAVETLIGAGVVVVGAALLSWAYGAETAGAPGYDLTATFDQVQGVGIGTPVLLAGVKIGTVSGQRLGDQFRAVLTLHVAPGTALPTDSIALVQTDGFLGGKFVAIDPGGDPTNMKPGDSFKVTQNSMSVNTILNLILSQVQASKAAPPATQGH